MKVNIRERDGVVILDAKRRIEGGPDSDSFRQLIKAGEGDADAGLVVIGMVLGGGLVQAWGLTATAAGVPLYGKVATLVGFLFIMTNSLLWRERKTA